MSTFKLKELTIYDYRTRTLIEVTRHYSNHYWHTLLLEEGSISTSTRDTIEPGLHYIQVTTLNR